MNEEKYLNIAEKLKETKDIAISQMFGKQCLKVNKKAFAAFFQDEMVFKLGASEIALVKQKYIGSVNWDPSGKKRPMKDWLQIPAEYIDDWLILAQQAIEFVEK
jgi:TfoX/Sxy family transcriptional regulator of competence genes